MRIEVARRLVEAWHKDSNALVAVRIGLLDSGEIPDRDAVIQEVGWIHGKAYGKRYLGRFYSIVADMLWAGKPDEVCVRELMRTKPDKRAKPMASKPVFMDKMFIEQRGRGPRSSDWKKVK